MDIDSGLRAKKLSPSSYILMAIRTECEHHLGLYLSLNRGILAHTKIAVFKNVASKLVQACKRIFFTGRISNFRAFLMGSMSMQYRGNSISICALLQY